MSAESIHIDKILVEDSIFSLKDYLFESSEGSACHLTSFDNLGILHPIIVYRDDERRYHLIDGRKRIQFARKSKESTIMAVVLQNKTSITDIVTMVFCNRRNEIHSSPVNKVQFICYAMGLNLDESWIVQSLCIPFEFKPHSDFLMECERINNLPRELKLFCHDKKFSIKQLLNLTYYPNELLAQLMKWKSDLQFTGSILDEISTHLRDVLKRDNLSIEKFISAPEVQEIFDSSLSPREKTDVIRQLINLKRFPILSASNEKIRQTINNLNLPKGIAIEWDKTLENRNIRVSLDVQNMGMWKDMLLSLQQPEIADAIKDILDEV